MEPENQPTPPQPPVATPPVQPAPAAPATPNVYPTPSTEADLHPNNAPVSAKTGMFSGRLNRIGYFVASLYILLLFVVPLVLTYSFRGKAIVNILALLVGTIGLVLVLPVSISIGIRRWHDMNKSGWYMLFGLIPYVGSLILIFYLFVPGTKGPNQYGEPDSSPSSPKKVLLGK